MDRGLMLFQTFSWFLEQYWNEKLGKENLCFYQAAWREGTFSWFIKKPCGIPSPNWLGQTFLTVCVSSSAFVVK